MELIAGMAFGLILGVIACWIIQESRAKSRLERQHARFQVDTARLEGELEQVHRAREIWETAERQLKDSFQATAREALQSNNQQFLTLAESKLGEALKSAEGKFSERHQEFQALVKPLKENYDKLNPNIESLTKQASDLAVETGKLSGALTNNRRIGDWGEMQLRRVVELAGMTNYCDFTEQQTLSDSSKKPDLIVRLPQGRKVVVDSKASLEAFLEAQKADDEFGRDDALRRHARALRSQVNDLARKDYGATEKGSLNFVVMFVPGDIFLAAALEAETSNGTNDANLISYAMSKRVAIATPSSLIALLWTVANGWEQQRISEKAEEIRDAGEELLKRLRIFMGHYEKVGRGLKSTLDAFNSSVGSYDGRVLPQGRRFADLRTGNEDDFPVTLGTMDIPLRTSRHFNEIESEN